MSGAAWNRYGDLELGDEEMLVPPWGRGAPAERCVLRRRLSDGATQWEVVRTGERFTLDASGAYLGERRAVRRHVATERARRGR